MGGTSNCWGGHGPPVATALVFSLKLGEDQKKRFSPVIEVVFRQI